VITILSVFASEAVTADGRYLHACIIDNGIQSEISIGNGLINMYSKSGDLDDARCVFEKMQQHDIVSWNAMIAAYAQHGKVSLALELFHKLRSKGMVTDKVTLVSILMACSHGGLVDEGFWFFIFAGVMERTIEHYNCLIDLLGRAGRLNELECVMMSMTIEPTYASWMTLLDACRKHFDLERGEVATNCIMDLEPSKCAPLVLLSNMYAHAGRWEDVNKVKGVMRGN
jgi:pentatricopeptide repeat protein